MRKNHDRVEIEESVAITMLIIYASEAAGRPAGASTIRAHSIRYLKRKLNNIYSCRKVMANVWNTTVWLAIFNDHGIQSASYVTCSKYWLLMEARRYSSHRRKGGRAGEVYLKSYFTQTNLLTEAFTNLLTKATDGRMLLFSHGT